MAQRSRRRLSYWNNTPPTQQEDQGEVWALCGQSDGVGNVMDWVSGENDENFTDKEQSEIEFTAIRIPLLTIIPILQIIRK